MFDLRLRAPMIGSVQGVSDSLEVFFLYVYCAIITSTFRGWLKIQSQGRYGPDSLELQLPRFVHPTHPLQCRQRSCPAMGADCMQTNQLSLRPTSKPSPQSNSAKPQEDEIQQLLCRSGQI